MSFVGSAASTGEGTADARLTRLWPWLAGAFVVLTACAHAAPIVRRQARLQTRLYRAQTPRCTALMQTVGLASSGWGMVPLTLLVTLYLTRTSKREALFTACNLLGVNTLHGGLELLLKRPRPTLYPALSLETTSAYPSGHVMAHVALWSGLWLRRPRPALLWLGVLSCLVVGFSRLYLQVHYALDVIAGVFAGGAWTLWLRRRFARSRG